MKLADDLTVGQLYDPTTVIKEQAAADEYFEALVERRMRCDGMAREEAEKVERSNIGYYAGYCGNETMLLVNLLYRAVHPVFGSGKS